MLKNPISTFGERENVCYVEKKSDFCTRFSREEMHKK